MYPFPCYKANQTRATANAPKPNTRFLKNIIRETDSHNAALRAKEQEESRARLKKLRNSNGTSPHPSDGYGRLTPEGDHRSKRRRVESENEGEYDRRRDHESRTDLRRVKEEGSRRHHRRHDEHYHTDEDEDGRSRHHHRRHRHHRSHRRRSTTRSRERRRKTKDEGGTRSRNQSRSGSLSTQKERRPHRRRPSRRSDSPGSQANGTRNAAKSRKDKRTVFPETKNDGSTNGKNYAASSASDSDPLEAIIGPPPPAPAPKIRSRGRGTFATSSAMDSHFSTNYDPSTDVQVDLNEVDDWDMALEAIRDRQHWQKQGAERLKSAGFTEEEVQKWEKGGERREEDVRWKGRGEGREWDRGKVVGEEGVETAPEWGRLKGT